MSDFVTDMTPSRYSRSQLNRTHRNEGGGHSVSHSCIVPPVAFHKLSNKELISLHKKTRNNNQFSPFVSAQGPEVRNRS